VATNLVSVAPAAKWIWNDSQAATAARPETLYFRKTVRLEKLPAKALAFVAADNSYTLFINGKKAGAGQNHERPDVLDIRPMLVKGENCIAVSAVNGGDKPNPAGVFLYVWLRPDRKNKTAAAMDFGTDASWSWSSGKIEGWEQPGFGAKDWHPAVELGDAGIAPWHLDKELRMALAAPEHYGEVRAVLANADPLQVALGRPNREQVVTTRIPAATTLQALELTNGHELADLIRRGAEKAMAGPPASSRDLIRRLYARALGRKPTSQELELAGQVVGRPVQPAGVEDLLWALAMLPEFQLIY